MSSVRQSIVVRYHGGNDYTVNEKRVIATSTFVNPCTELTAQENYAVMHFIKHNRFRRVSHSFYTY